MTRCSHENTNTLHTGRKTIMIESRQPCDPRQATMTNARLLGPRVAKKPSLIVDWPKDYDQSFSSLDSRKGSCCTSSPTPSSRPPKRRVASRPVVRIDESQNCVRVNSDVMTDDEKEATWYTTVEYSHMRAEIRDTINVLQKAGGKTSSLDVSKRCVRGIEHLKTDRHLDQLNHNRTAVICGVLDEQDYLRQKNGKCNPLKLGLMSETCTAWARGRAYAIGLADARAAEKIHCLNGNKTKEAAGSTQRAIVSSHSRKRQRRRASNESVHSSSIFSGGMKPGRIPLSCVGLHNSNPKEMQPLTLLQTLERASELFKNDLV